MNVFCGMYLFKQIILSDEAAQEMLENRTSRVEKSKTTMLEFDSKIWLIVYRSQARNITTDVKVYNLQHILLSKCSFPLRSVTS